MIAAVNGEVHAERRRIEMALQKYEAARSREDRAALEKLITEIDTGIYTEWLESRPSTKN